MNDLSDLLSDNGEDEPVTNNIASAADGLGLPKLYTLCSDVFKMMNNRSSVFDSGNGVVVRTYTGFVSKDVIELTDVSISYYTQIMQKLIEMDCIVRLRRGGGTSPSVWELKHAPTPELWNAKKLGKMRSNGAVNQGKIFELTRALSELQEKVDELITVVNAHARQIIELQG